MFNLGQVAGQFAILGLVLGLALSCGSESIGKHMSQPTMPSATAAPTVDAVVSPSTMTPAEEAPPLVRPNRPPVSVFEGSAAAVVNKGNSALKAVTLTFDAGSDAGYTSQILDTLRAFGIVAAFGITGHWAEQNPGLLQRIVAEGHQVINHSFDHASFTGVSSGRRLSQEERWQQLDATEQVIQSVAGVGARPFFRPPFGDYDASVNQDIAARGYLYNIMWTVDSRGWQGLPADQIAERCLTRAEPGAIYIFHVGSASQDGPALPGIIEGLRAQGYAIVSLSGILA